MTPETKATEPLIYATFANGKTIKAGDSLKSVLHIFKEVLDEYVDPRINMVPDSYKCI